VCAYVAIVEMPTAGRSVRVKSAGKSSPGDVTCSPKFLEMLERATKTKKNFSFAPQSVCSNEISSPEKDIIK
jgi:hypothetical protein